MTRLGLIVMAGVIAGCALVGLAHAQYPTQIQPNGAPAYAPPPAYIPPPYLPQGAGPFNGQSAGSQMYGR
jgi:hypothetical protein